MRRSGHRSEAWAGSLTGESRWPPITRISLPIPLPEDRRAREAARQRSIHEILEVSRHASSNSERGAQFDKLVVQYFELDPMLSQQFRHGVAEDRLA